MADRTTPYGAFNYVVNFDGGEVFGGFSDVSGIGTEVTVAEYRNGNEKENHVRKLGGVHKVSDVTLKRGILKDSDVIRWCKDALQGHDIKPAILRVSLLNEEHQPVMTWKVHNAWPRKWSVSDFNATENAIVVETIDICYSYFEVET